MNHELKKTPSPLNLRFLVYFGFAYLILSVIFDLQRTSVLSYSDFRDYLKQNKVQEVTVKGDEVVGEFKSLVNGKKRFETTIVPRDLQEEFDKYGIKYNSVQTTKASGFIFSFLFPFFLFIGIWYYMIKRSFGKGGGLGPGFMSVGKSKAKIYVETDTKTTFKDVAAADEALEELQEVIEFLKNSEKIKKLGGKMPKGVLLIGPPGTGKTLIAKAIAGEAGVPFFSTNGAEFVEMFVGVGAARVRDLFEQAKASAPCIIFIDELDALGKARHSSALSGNDEKEQTLNQLLVELDGFDTKSGIIILAATNRPEIIDPALLRAGRFDRQILIDKPDKKGRIEILKIHTKSVKLSPDIKLEEVAALTPGFSGADLANMVNESALIATRENAEVITIHHFTSALERMLTGLQKKNRLLNLFERTVVAHHEMGHALVGHFYNQTEVIHKVSIIPRGIGSLGYTIHRPMDDRYLMTEQELQNKMAVLLAGRAAEALIFSHLSTGAADDLVKASNIAREMVTKYGMSRHLGFVSYEEPGQSMLSPEMLLRPANYSDKTAEEIDENIRLLCMDAFRKAYNFLSCNRQILEASAEELLKLETLAEAELDPFFKKLKAAEGSLSSLQPNLKAS